MESVMPSVSHGVKIVWSGVHERRKALETLLFALAMRGGGGYEMNLSWSGQHTRGKALPIGLKALPPGDVLHVLGEGRETARWKRLAQKLGVADHVVWHGWLPKDEAQRVMAEADVFVITSIRDLTSTVLLEALSAGLPVVCLDHCGFADVVDESCGIKVPVGKPKDVVAGFAAALERLHDEDLRKRLSDGAKRRAAEYAWERKREALERIYRPKWKKVLVSVYACSPSRGSEPGMGWNFLRLVARNREVWALVEEEKWRGDIEKWLSEHLGEMANVHFVFIRKPRCRWLRRIWPPSYYWFYRVWQWRAYRVARRLHAEVGFDCAHQLNMVGFREPGYLWKLPMPFIWGPIGGLDLTDWRLFGLLGFGGKIEFFCRNVINWCHAHFLRRPRLAAHRAAASGAFICATGENAHLAKRLWGVDSTVLCEVGT